MNLMHKTVCTLTVLAAASTSVWAVDSADLKVIGTIKPTACTPMLSATGVVDYGTILAGDLEAENYNDLGVKKVDFSLVCDAPTHLAIKAVSNRLGSVVSDQPEGAEGFAVAPITLFGASGVEAAGLGLEGVNKIGGYAARIRPTSSHADSIYVDTIISTDGGTVWSATSTPNISTNTQILSWAAAGTVEPVALTALAAELEVNAYLNKTEAFDITKIVNLDGLTTIEVVYL